MLSQYVVSTGWAASGDEADTGCQHCPSSGDAAKEGWRDPVSTSAAPGEEGRAVTGALQVASDSQASAGGDLGQGNCKSLPGDSRLPYGSVMPGTDTPQGFPQSLLQPPGDTNPGAGFVPTGRESHHAEAFRSSSHLLAIWRIPGRSPPGRKPLLRLCCLSPPSHLLGNYHS